MEHTRIVSDALASGPIHHPRAYLPAPAVMAILSRFERQHLANFITVAVDLLDAIDGDPDVEVEDLAGETVPVIDRADFPPEEDDGDPDLEETGAEDSFMAHRYADGPGCPVGDPDAEHDGREVTGAEDDCMFHLGSGPGCQLSDPGGYHGAY